MKEEKLKFLIPPEKIVKKVGGDFPRSGLSELVDMFNPVVASRIMMAFAGRTLYLPSRSTIYRTMVCSYVRTELKNLKGGSPRYEMTVGQLAHLFQKSKFTIKKIHENGKYL